jgi:hypothetical protein
MVLYVPCVLISYVPLSLGVTNAMPHTSHFTSFGVVVDMTITKVMN